MIDDFGNPALLQNSSFVETIVSWVYKFVGQPESEKFPVRVFRCGYLALAWGCLSLVGMNASATEFLPFVGCIGSDRDTAETAPKGKPVPTAMNAKDATQLAYYSADNDAYSISVLAPRGWYCSSSAGSAGSSLLIVPSAKAASSWDLTGPYVLLESIIGDTSGRFIFAPLAARFFPKVMPDYVESVFQEGSEWHESRRDFEYPADPFAIVTYKSKTTLEFTTPAHRDGLGTRNISDNRSIRSALPIYGMLAVGGPPNR